MSAAVPAVPFADHRDPLGVRRPDREAHAGDAVDRRRIRAQRAVRFEQAPAVEKMKIEFAHRRRESVRVEKLGLGAVALDAQPERRRRRCSAVPHEEIGFAVAAHRPRTIVDHQPRVRRARQERAVGVLAGVAVQAEEGARIVQPSGEQPLAQPVAVGPGVHHRAIIGRRRRSLRAAGRRRSP
jgi:hypothetical protein